MISATGRRPVTDAPSAQPTIACSEIGVSRTRRGPNRSKQPGGRLEDAAGGADVLAEHEDAIVALELLGRAPG